MKYWVTVKNNEDLKIKPLYSAVDALIVSDLKIDIPNEINKIVFSVKEDDDIMNREEIVKACLQKYPDKETILSFSYNYNNLLFIERYKGVSPNLKFCPVVKYSQVTGPKNFLSNINLCVALNCDYVFLSEDKPFSMHEVTGYSGEFESYIVNNFKNIKKIRAFNHYSISYDYDFCAMSQGMFNEVIGE